MFLKREAYLIERQRQFSQQEWARKRGYFGPRMTDNRRMNRLWLKIRSGLGTLSRVRSIRIHVTVDIKEPSKPAHMNV